MIPVKESMADIGGLENLKQWLANKERVLRNINKAMEYGVKMVCLAGGVSANSYLREEIIKKFSKTDIDVIIPPIWCTTDNAAMIAKVAEHLYERKVFADLSIGVDPNWKIEEYDKFEN